MNPSKELSSKMYCYINKYVKDYVFIKKKLIPYTDRTSEEDY